MYESEFRKLSFELSATSKYFIPAKYNGWNKYYNQRNEKTHSLLPNCTGGAFGISMQIMGTTDYHKVDIPIADALYWYGMSGWKRSKYPVLGAVACWGGKGKGHVAIVKDLVRDSNGNVLDVTSVLESSYYSYDGKNWREGKNYTYNANTGTLAKKNYVFLGYLLNPNVEIDPVEHDQLKKGDFVEIRAAGNSRKDGNGKKSLGIGYKRYILKIFPNDKYPYQVGSAGGTVTGYYKASALRLLSTDLNVGDKVSIIAPGNSNAAGTGKTAYGIGWQRYIISISNGAEYPYCLGNKKGVVTGYYKEDAIKRV